MSQGNLCLQLDASKAAMHQTIDQVNDEMHQLFCLDFFFFFLFVEESADLWIELYDVLMSALYI